MCPPAPARSPANLPYQPKEARSASVALHRFGAGIWCFGKARAKTISWDAHLLAVITRTDCCAFKRDSSQGLLSTSDGWRMHPSLKLIYERKPLHQNTSAAVASFAHHQVLLVDFPTSTPSPILPALGSCHQKPSAPTNRQSRAHASLSMAAAPT